MDTKQRIAVLTSGGDSQGMNAALRAVVRTCLRLGAEVFEVREGLQGLVDGGDFIRPANWDSVSGILQQGGTVLGTARSEEFRSVDGRRKAVRNLLAHEIDRLVVIGGDGSLTGSDLLRREWPEHLAELVSRGEAAAAAAERHPELTLVGLPGSIDNDLCGTDMTIGADTALARIVEAADAIFSTASSHQRAFVIEVMGRNCGYLALMSALAIGAEWLLIPEAPPESDDWEAEMCTALRQGRKAGRRASIVIVSEGARDREGQPITSRKIQQTIKEKLGEDARVTILGHVQRGGSPTAFDRTLSTLLGHRAAQEATAPDNRGQSGLIGLVGNRPARIPLEESLKRTAALAEALRTKDFATARELRGGSFARTYATWKTLVQAQPASGKKGKRLAILHAGGPAPGMNMAARAAVRLALDRGDTVLGVRSGFKGLVEQQVRELGWMDVSGWAPMGGAELGTHRFQPSGRHLYSIARAIEQHQIEGILMIGGWDGYEAAHHLHTERARFPAFDLPIVCLPASIDNNLPGSELSIGADTALNCIVEAVDKIKRSGVATRRCFIVEVMGALCGYLALMSGMATGAELVYLNEEGITAQGLLGDLESLSQGFRRGKRIGLVIRNEMANLFYSTSFVAALFEEEGGDLFDVRQAILGHLQQGGDPTPFDRIQAVRMARACVDRLDREMDSSEPASLFLGTQRGELCFFELQDFPRMVDQEHRRPKSQWWLEFLEIARTLA
ncbi:MAG: 6-phosphofructokinase [Armatimonadetes bacterium]|nr:6-phosphofructokinase [Armatimonadota bacterium]